MVGGIEGREVEGLEDFIVGLFFEWELSDLGFGVVVVEIDCRGFGVELGELLGGFDNILVKEGVGGLD